MVRCGLDLLLNDFPEALKNTRIGLLCHAASITGSGEHAVDAVSGSDSCTIAAILGPQHGLYGQTQDNMVEWDGYTHPELGVPVYSLYGETRKPTPAMLEGLDALVIDLQDVGARPYTYIWTIKLCMEACAEAGLAVWVLDRPNPIAALAADGALLDQSFYSFVGGLHIPLCHRMTLAEMARLIQREYVPDVDLHTIAMQGWWRNSLWPETELPWVLPSPNMPTFDTAVVYPGMVLLEATNLSEGRGTTRPFELFGAPYLPSGPFEKAFEAQHVSDGCSLRRHNFIPTFQKWQGELCTGWQIHVHDARAFRPVRATVGLFAAALEVSDGGFAFKDPPYEYEAEKMPVDILAGDTTTREELLNGDSATDIASRWESGLKSAAETLSDVSLYPEERQ